MITFKTALPPNTNMFSLLSRLSSISQLPGIFYLVLLQATELVCEATSTTTTTTSARSANNDDNSGMLKGMAAGFGGFIGLIVLICVFWCCCCNQDESSSRWCCKEKPQKPGQPTGHPRVGDRAKVGPSPPQSAASSWSRSR